MARAPEKFRQLRTSKSASALALRAAGARVITLPLQAVASLTTAGILIRHYGTDSYALYALAISLVAVLPFADLGIGAAVVNATATLATSEQRHHAVAVVSAALRALLMVSTVSIAAGIVIAHTIGWETILGETFDPAGNNALLACVVIFAFTLPLSLGQRIALGIGANDRQLLLQGMQPLLTLTFVLICVHSSGSIQLAYFGFFTSYMVTLLIIAVAADRWSDGLLRQATKQLFRSRTQPGSVSIFSTALPMCVVYIGLPLVLQTHRIMLSHFGDADQVAQYSLAAQMYLPVIAIVSAASTSLWSVFARERVTSSPLESKKTSSPIRFSIIMATVSLTLCGMVTLVAPFIAPLISDGKIIVSPLLAVCFSAFVIAQSAQLPLGVYLTNVPGLRLQAVTTLIFLPLVWAVAWVLIPIIGAGGPALSTAAAGVLIQIVPFALAVRLFRRAGSAADLSKTR